MKNSMLSFLAGILVTLGYLYSLGPEAIVQAGLKLAAMQADYDFVSVPREAESVSYDTRSLVVMPAPPAKRVARR